MTDVNAMRAAEDQIRADMKAWFDQAALVTAEDDAFCAAEDRGSELQRRLEKEHGFTADEAQRLLYPGLNRLHEIRYGRQIHEQ